MRTGPTLHCRFVSLLAKPRLGWLLCAAALCLTAPSLFIGFYQDDYVARYIYSDLEGAGDLYRAYAGGYGISNGVPADNHWQAEAGHAPWWIFSELQVALLRPISQATHELDVRFWPRSSALMHAHSLLGFGALVLAPRRPTVLLLLLGRRGLCAVRASEDGRDDRAPGAGDRALVSDRGHAVTPSSARA